MTLFRYGLALALVGVTVWMCVDNVFSDPEPTRALAEKAACTKKSCAEHHGLVRETRRPWGQSIDYAWHDTTIHVSCRREYWVFGERQCTAE